MVVLFFGALIALVVLGSQGSNEYTPIPMNDDPVVALPTNPSMSDASPTTSMPISPALVDPTRTIVDACRMPQAEQQSVDVPAGFDPIAEGGRGSFAQVVRPVWDVPKVIATLDLGSGEIEPTPDFTRIESIGARSAMVACVTPADPLSVSVLLCASPNTGMDGSPEYYSVIDANRYRIRVFELATGRVLGEDMIQADVAACQDGYLKVETSDVDGEHQRLRAQSHRIWTTNVDVADDEIATWAVTHLKGGTYR